MAKITDFYDYILSEIPCTKAMAASKIRQTCSDFCSRAAVWRYKPGVIRTRSNVAEYLIPRRSGTSVVKVLSLKDSEAGIEYKNASSERQSNGFSFLHPNPHNIILIPTPGEVRTLTIEVTLKPLLTSDDIDDILVDRWSDAIIEGTLHRLKSMPGKSWTDLTSALKVHHVNYERQVRKAVDIDLRGHSGGSVVIQPGGGYF